MITFIKGRTPPPALLTLDAAIPRLKPHHPQIPELRYQMARYQKGYNGERKLDYYLKSLDKRFSILNDVTLSVFGKQFQIDSLILTGYGNFFVEVKNLEGIVTFDTDLGQLIQDNGSTLTGQKYPITQAENIQFHLMRWLQMHQLDGMPMYYFIAFSDQRTIIKVNGNEEPVRNLISNVDEIPLRLMSANEKLARGSVENNQLKNRIIQTVMQNCEELDIDILGKSGVNLNDILPGVRCPACGKLGMLRTRYRWYCAKCGIYSRDAHLGALSDYALIFGNEITNRQCQDFLGVDRSAAYSLLKGVAGATLKKDRKVWELDVKKLRA